MGQLARKTRETQVQRQQARPQDGIAAMLRDRWPQIQAVMPRHMSSERLFQLAVSSINHTPQLLEATPETILACVMKCSALGLEPSAVDGLGRAYILPYRNRKAGIVEAQFILGYKGMLELCRNSGELRSIEARVVHEGDVFEFEYGLNETLRHVPCANGGKMTHVYCVAKFKDGGHYIDVMTKDEVDAIRKRSKASQSGPWETDYEAMARKTVIRRAFPYLPVSVEAQEAAASDETTPDYGGVLNPVIEVADAVMTDAAPEQPAGPTDEEKAELRRLTIGCVAAGVAEQEAKRQLFSLWRDGGMDAARSYAQCLADDAAVDLLVERCAASGYDRDDTKTWLLGIRSSRGMDAARSEAERIIAEAAANAEANGVDAETGEVVDAVVGDLASEDIAF